MEAATPETTVTVMITDDHLVKVAVYIAPDSSKGEIMTFKNDILK
jgi:hypothetical protein